MSNPFRKGADIDAPYATYVNSQGWEWRILKTYKDPKSYYAEGDLIVFDRSLGIKRNAVVLPEGYELVSCNFPSQVIEEADGRLAISHWNNSTWMC